MSLSQKKKRKKKRKCAISVFLNKIIKNQRLIEILRKIEKQKEGDE